MIPKILHFVWVGDDAMPEYAERNIEEFRKLNPDYEIMMHGEESLAPQYRAAYAGVELMCQKADLIRLSALRQHGGWYADVDCWPVRTLDDAASAHGLDGGKLFFVDSGRRTGYTNCYMAVGAWWNGWDAVDNFIARQKDKARNAYGPLLVNWLAEKHPEKCATAGAAFWMPVGIDEARAVYRKCVRDGNDILRQYCPDTHGQLPFGIHLWAGTNDKDLRDGGIAADGKVMIMYRGDRARYPFEELCTGAKAAGYTAYDIRANGKWADIPDVTVIWNGMREPTTNLVRKLKGVGSQVWYAEHGFYNRSKYIQLDYKGFLHRASWAEHVAEPAPKCGKARYEAVVSQPIKPVRRTHGGYILVLGQVPGDTQMMDSEIDGPLPLQRLLRPYLGKHGFRSMGVQTYFRPHPLASNIKSARKELLEPFPDGGNEVRNFQTNKHGTGLQEALEGAMFVITINSNAIVEALGAGVPCMAFGPSVGITAGAVRPTSQETLKQDLLEMIDGWMPSQDAVDNYLYWLAARQWNREECKQPELFEALARGDAAIEMEPLPCP